MLASTTPRRPMKIDEGSSDTASPSPVRGLRLCTSDYDLDALLGGSLASNLNSSFRQGVHAAPCCNPMPENWRLRQDVATFGTMAAQNTAARDCSPPPPPRDADTCGSAGIGGRLGDVGSRSCSGTISRTQWAACALCNGPADLLTSSGALWHPDRAVQLSRQRAWS